MSKATKYPFSVEYCYDGSSGKKCFKNTALCKEILPEFCIVIIHLFINNSIALPQQQYYTFTHSGFFIETKFQLENIFDEYAKEAMRESIYTKMQLFLKNKFDYGSKSEMLIKL